MSLQVNDVTVFLSRVRRGGPQTHPQTTTRRPLSACVGAMPWNLAERLGRLRTWPPFPLPPWRGRPGSQCSAGAVQCSLLWAAAEAEAEPPRATGVSQRPQRPQPAMQDWISSAHSLKAIPSLSEQRWSRPRPSLHLQLKMRALYSELLVWAWILDTCRGPVCTAPFMT